MTNSSPPCNLQNGLQKLLPHEEEDFLCSFFPLLSFWLSVGQGPADAALISWGADSHYYFVYLGYGLIQAYLLWFSWGSGG